jgi:nicotinate-nucleotide adenylyltransferase
MTRLAIADQPGFILSLADAPKAHGAPNFTIETLLALRAELPPEGEIFCLMGADSFAGLKRWHRSSEIPFAAPLIVASRPGERLEDLEALLPAGLAVDIDLLAGEKFSFGTKAHIVLRHTLRNSSGDRTPLFLLPGLEIPISASEIREQLRMREPNIEPLPAPVLDYIRTHLLYRDLLPPG